MRANMTHELDVRGLPPPEPFEQIMRVLPTLNAGASLHVLIHREPYPLYEVLRENGYAWQTTVRPDGSCSIRISRSA
jgi:tRNA 2-thiouridine synthesizing protein A